MSSATNSAIVILGHTNDAQGELSDIAQQRCSQGAALYQQNPMGIICTGAFGESFNTSGSPHAHHLQQYLIPLGVSEQDFLPITFSRNTYEDGKLTAKTITQLQLDTVYLVTSDFHLQRAFLWFKLFSPETRVIPCAAKTSASNAYLEELKAHEIKALATFYRDFPDFPQVETFDDWRSPIH